MLVFKVSPLRLGLESLKKTISACAAVAVLGSACAWAQVAGPMGGPRPGGSPGVIAEPMPSGSADAAPIETAPSITDTWKVGAKLGQGLKKFGKKYDVSKIGDRGIGKGVNFYSLEKEQALGKELSQEVESTSKLLSDPALNEYINRIGQTIVRNSDAKVPFTIKIIDNDEVNAFALPGGFFYVNTGLIMAADNEAELAGVMAHEIAHVAARHATKNATKGEIWNIASVPLIFVGGAAGYAIRQAAGLAVPMSFLKFSRDAEREADLLGLEYQYASGYDPAAFVQFFEKLKIKDKHKANFLAKAFSTHPMTEDRMKRAQDEIESLLPAREQYTVDTSEFEQMKTRLAKLENRGRIENNNPTRPTLHRRTPDSPTGKDSSGKDSKDDPDRPTLKKKTD